jgi:hypothetical protein
MPSARLRRSEGDWVVFLDPSIEAEQLRSPHQVGNELKAELETHAGATTLNRTQNLSRNEHNLEVQRAFADVENALGFLQGILNRSAKLQGLALRDASTRQIS